MKQRIESLDDFIKIVESAKFYNSNTDKYETPSEKGWYIQYHTESGDQGYIKVDREPKNKKDALDMLNKINPDEIYLPVLFWSEVK
jgi:outer membrane protein assembly factor BamA